MLEATSFDTVLLLAVQEVEEEFAFYKIFSIFAFLNFYHLKPPALQHPTGTRPSNRLRV